MYFLPALFLQSNFPFVLLIFENMAANLLGFVIPEWIEFRYVGLGLLSKVSSL